MKKLIVLTILLIASQAMALTASWTHNGVNTVGYTLWFWQTSTPTAVNNKSVVGSTIRNIAMSVEYFAAGDEYSFSMSAFHVV